MPDNRGDSIKPYSAPLPPVEARGGNLPRTRKSLVGMVTSYASRLRFPTLFLITLGLFLVDLFILDPIPLVDEILLGLVTLLLASLRKSAEEHWRTVDEPKEIS